MTSRREHPQGPMTPADLTARLVAELEQVPQSVVHVDHCALLAHQRGTYDPGPMAMAPICHCPSSPDFPALARVAQRRMVEVCEAVANSIGHAYAAADMKGPTEIEEGTAGAVACSVHIAHEIRALSPEAQEEGR